VKSIPKTFLLYLEMDLQQLLFINCVTTKGPHSLSSAPAMVISLVAMLPSRGIPAIRLKPMQMHSSSPSPTLMASPPPNILARTKQRQCFAICHMVQFLEEEMIFLLPIIRTKTTPASPNSRAVTQTLPKWGMPHSLVPYASQPMKLKSFL
jgi:hypothetical protein